MHIFRLHSWPNGLLGWIRSVMCIYRHFTRLIPRSYEYCNVENRPGNLLGIVDLAGRCGHFDTTSRTRPRQPELTHGCNSTMALQNMSMRVFKLLLSWVWTRDCAGIHWNGHQYTIHLTERRFLPKQSLREGYNPGWVAALMQNTRLSVQEFGIQPMSAQALFHERPCWIFNIPQLMPADGAARFYIHPMDCTHWWITLPVKHQDYSL